MKYPSKMPLLVLLTLGLLCACSNENKKLVTSDTDFRLITHNVWYGFTKVPDRKNAWTKWIKQQEPDVVSLQELNGYTPEKLKEDADIWDHSYSVLLKKKGFPTGITSRYPIEDVQRTLEGFHHGLLRVRIKGIYFYVVHLHPSDYEARRQEINLLLEDIEKLTKNASVVLAGDFNALSQSDSVYYSDGDLERFFRQRDTELNEQNLNRGRLDYDVISKVTANSFVDTEKLTRQRDYYFPGTFPTSIKKEGSHGDKRRIDYIFVNKNFIENVKNVKIISNEKTQVLSDHLPVIADFLKVGE